MPIYDYVNEKERRIANAKHKEMDSFIIIKSFLNNLITEDFEKPNHSNI